MGFNSAFKGLNYTLPFIGVPNRTCVSRFVLRPTRPLTKPCVIRHGILIIQYCVTQPMRYLHKRRMLH